MPRNSRKDLQGLFHHIMAQGINKEYIFDDDNLKNRYKAIIKDKIKQNNVNIIAYCIMDNHVHMLVNIQKIEDMCKFMQQVNTTYAKFYNKLYNRVGYVFRNRYLAKPILDERNLKKCVVYIHRNPVVAKMTKKKSEYKFSSYNEYLEKIDEKLIYSNSSKILFGEVSKKKFKQEYEEIHNYQDCELTEFDNYEEKDKLNIEKTLAKYYGLSDYEKIIKLNIEEKISERKLAEIFNKTRYEIRKILKKELQASQRRQPD